MRETLFKLYVQVFLITLQQPTPGENLFCEDSLHCNFALKMPFPLNSLVCKVVQNLSLWPSVRISASFQQNKQKMIRFPHEHLSMKVPNVECVFDESILGQIYVKNSMVELNVKAF